MNPRTRGHASPTEPAVPSPEIRFARCLRRPGLAVAELREESLTADPLHHVGYRREYLGRGVFAPMRR
jgi:hypothetical protein